jgi:2-iminobutanoate/2-iminopropanoate deaminase
MERVRIQTSHAPAALGPYSQAIQVGEFIYTSGQIALDPTTAKIVGEGDISAQTIQVLKNLSAVLESAGSSLQKVIKTTVFLTDMDHFTAMNDAYAAFFPENPPARSTVAVRTLPKNVLVEIECVALSQD